ncbi:Bug family tripartite tricarboxylate transporter substrate binding protein [Roseococcus sp.]|uniref:Bug family tripartite tricarboxylate transporter substrate binding protein n=1 Tax=Roseococcus sp. TaxID=2109646 RepID=UPI003BA8BF2C
MQRRSLLGAAAALPALDHRAMAQGSAIAGWPSRPVRILVGFPPGGLPDVYARLLSDRLSAMLAQPVIVENRPGGGGTLANEQLARTEDGHTFMSTSISMTAGAALRAGQIGYDVLRDIAPVSLISVVANGVLVHPSVPARTIEEFVALAKAQPGRVTCASPGNGTSGHVTQEYFKLRTGTDMVHVPYRGSGPLLPDFLGGQVQSVIDNIPVYMPHVREGRLRLLAVTTPQRWPSEPAVPTLAETMAPGFDVRAWFGVVAPVRTPGPVLEAMNRLVVAALNEPGVARRVREGGAEPAPTSRAEFGQFMREDMERWTEVVRVSGAKAD